MLDGHVISGILYLGFAGRGVMIENDKHVDTPSRMNASMTKEHLAPLPNM